MPEPDLEQWRAEVDEWLVSVLPRRADRGDAAPDYAIFANITEDAEHALLDRVREYRRQRFDAGYGAIALPTELGGAGLSARYVVAFTAAEQAFERPTSTELISVTCGLVGPTIATFGTDEQRDKFARAFLRSDLLCCQLFSEPGAGSDLAAVATTAVAEDNGWLINGQKVWSSGARFADYGLLLARTDPEVAKQAGLTMFLIPMDAPGVESPTDQADERRIVVQRGVPVRRAHRRRHAGGAGRRRLEGRERHARVRAHRQRSGHPAQGRHLRRPARAGASPRQGDRSGRAPATRRRVRAHRNCGRPPPIESRGRRRRAPRPGRRRRSARSSRRRTSPGSARSRPRCSAPVSPPTPANRTRSPGPSTCSARPAIDWPAAPTRSSATSSASACSACPANRASTAACRTRSCRAAAESSKASTSGHQPSSVASRSRCTAASPKSTSSARARRK